MDYFGILKRAWDITWQNKALWVLGFFAVASSGSTGGSNSAQWRESYSSTDMEPFVRWTEQNLGLLIALVIALVLLGMVMAVLGVAARGGLVHLVNEAEEDRSVRLADGWRVGFKYWGRTFMISLVLGLPILAIVLVLALIVVGAGFGLAAGGDPSAAAGVGFGGALCCLLPMVVILTIAIGVITGIINELAVRYGVLQDVTFGQAIRRGWDDLWAKRGAAVMWLVMLLPQFAYGVIVLVAALVILLPVFLLFASGAVVIGVLLVLLLVLVLMVPGAVYNTFFSASWTVFFRSMTGVRVISKAPAVGTGQGYMPPPPVVPTPGVTEDGSEA